MLDKALTPAQLKRNLHWNANLTPAQFAHTLVRKGVCDEEQSKRLGERPDLFVNEKLQMVPLF
jgi:hypothetical protein